MAALVEEALQLGEHGAEAFQHLLVREAADGVAVPAQTQVALSVRGEAERPEMLGPVDLDHASFGTPEQVDADRVAERS